MPRSFNACHSQNIIFNLKTVSVRDLREDWPQILAWVQAGEEVVVTMRRKDVARLVPCAQKKVPKRPFPDIAVRLKKIFGTKVIPDKAMKDIMDYDHSK